LSESAFLAVRYREAYRNRYTRAHSLLAVIHCENFNQDPQAAREFLSRLALVCQSIRGSDAIGWMRTGYFAGILFNDLREHSSEHLEKVVSKRLQAAGFPARSIRLEWPGEFEVEEDFVFAPSPPAEVLARIANEQKRSERSGRQFILGIVGRRMELPVRNPDEVLLDFISALGKSLQPFDTVGWLEYGQQIVVTFAESDSTGRHVTGLAGAMSAAADRCNLDPDNIITENYPYPQNPILEPVRGSKFEQGIKRGIDLIGSAVGLLALSPLFAAIAVAVKCSSKGPVFFRQQRVGRKGKEFTFYKFRSMKTNNDSSEHQKFVEALIAGEKPGDGDFKIKNDSRVTPLGSFLRQTSLDELPQLYNVLRGEMSLVGPRPAIPYEVHKYSLWHRRRLYGAQPGMTGLWQVEGRSRVGFDDMVRLDLQYVANWSIWLDLRILLKTPRAVVTGKGAR
jgi:lipopolysaccharide/colanic/teichoic acid biosynthesis glycosyltransferase